MSSARKKAAKPTRATVRRRKPALALAAVQQPGTPIEAEPVADPAPEPEVSLAAPPAAPEAPAPPAAAATPAAPPPPAGLKLEGSCTIRDSIDMQFQLLAMDFGDSDVLVDGSAVERIDTAGLQMLVSFAIHQAGRGKAVRWTAVSPELARGGRLLGLSDMLGLPDSDIGSEVRGD